MKLGWLFLLAGVSLLILVGSSSWSALNYALGFGGGGLLLVGLAYLRGWPGILGKRRGGQLMFSSYILFWPYHLLNWTTFAFFRWISREPPFHEVAPGLFVGARLLPADAARFRSLGIASALDLTAEFAETRFVRAMPGYLCIPLLDRSVPTMDELDYGVSFLTQRLAVGPVYVHCALGHGRSAVFAAAYLLKQGLAKTPQAAVAQLREKRAGIRPSQPQVAVLNQFINERGNFRHS